MAIPNYIWLEDRHVVTAHDVGNLYATFVSWGRHGFGESFGYAEEKPHFARQPWKVYTMSSWLLDSNGVLKEGQVVTLGEIGEGAGTFVELASAVQGPGQKARFLSDVGYPVTHGLFVILWNTLTANDVLWTRIKYEVMR